MSGYEKVVEILTKNNKTISTMESCTGGALANGITNVNGSSLVFKFGAVTYSNEYKIKMGVSKDIIDKFTVYSSETAKDMSRAITDYTNSNYGIGITGQLNISDINNPYGEVGKVFICIFDKDNNTFYEYDLITNKSAREENKEIVCDFVIQKLLDILTI